MSTPRIDCPIIVLVGPTAIGKTELSFTLVHEFDCEIISMDSMQVYRYMDIGTAKPGSDELNLVKHHLVDILNPDEQYNAAQFINDCLLAIEQISNRGKTVLLTGGTGLYLQALINGLFDTIPGDPIIRKQLQSRLTQEGREVLHAELSKIDPETGKRIHMNDTQRLLRGLEIYLCSGTTWSAFLDRQKKQSRGQIFTRMKIIGLTCSRERLYERIGERSRAMVHSGLIEEVENLYKMGYGPELNSMQSIGYRHAGALLSGVWNFDTMIEALRRDTRRYAKRQMTWFNRTQELCWFNRNDKEKVIEAIKTSIF